MEIRKPLSGENETREGGSAAALTDLRVPPSHRPEASRGDRKGQVSPRINDQWRVCFVWTDRGAIEIEVTDHH